jgi:hypothetical protein
LQFYGTLYRPMNVPTVLLMHNNYKPFTKATSNFSKYRMTRKLSDSRRTMKIFRQLSYRPCSILQSLAG